MAFDSEPAKTAFAFTVDSEPAKTAFAFTVACRIGGRGLKLASSWCPRGLTPGGREFVAINSSDKSAKIFPYGEELGRRSPGRFSPANFLLQLALWKWTIRHLIVATFADCVCAVGWASLHRSQAFESIVDSC